MSKQNQNNTLRNALNKAKMSKSRKDLLREQQQVQREKNKIEQQRRQSRLLQEEREE